MTTPAILTVEALGKRYSLRHGGDNASYAALRDVLSATVAAPLRWLRGESSARATREDFWALKDVSFAVTPGEVVGIIGRNGAGKSTLLKILSRITEPTEGRVTLYGRVSSLLEVGTGFHPELTGRENIFLNGAILGMSRAEISRKFDEIVAFADVERFLDTPVKHYSSGMYVRLAFAVAAHLEPEILVVDEVLAVGDAEFQKRCLGKMRDASKSGRTVLFVSHNLAAVKSLTTRGIVLSEGRGVFDGTSGDAIDFYLGLGAARSPSAAYAGRGRHTTIRSARLLDEAGGAVSSYTPGTRMRIEVVFDTDGTPSLSLEAMLKDPGRHSLGLASLHQFHGRTLPEIPGRYGVVLELAEMWLASGSYSLDLTTSMVNASWDHFVEAALEFDVIAANVGGQSWDFRHNFGYGAVAMACVRQVDFSPVPDEQ